MLNCLQNPFLYSFIISKKHGERTASDFNCHFFCRALLSQCQNGRESCDKCSRTSTLIIASTIIRIVNIQKINISWCFRVIQSVTNKNGIMNLNLRQAGSIFTILMHKHFDVLAWIKSFISRRNKWYYSSDIISLSILVEKCLHHWKMEALIYMCTRALDFWCQVKHLDLNDCMCHSFKEHLMCEQCLSLYVVRKPIY